jgi:acyl-CoA thioesterase-2
VTRDTVPPPTEGSTEEAALRMLLGLLDLREVGTAQIRVDDAPGTEIALGDSSAQVFVGQSQKMAHNRVFGGQVLAQGVMAAGLTLDLSPGSPPRPIHSLHAYFMRPGDDTQPIRFAVERMMDGRSFTTRRVHAIQHGRPILSMSASFQEDAPGLDHQDPMPDVPGPAGIPSLAELFGDMDNPRAQQLARRPIEQRHVEGHPYLRGGGPADPTDQHIWMRTVGPLPDDPLLHAAVLAYASDYSMLEPALQRQGISFGDPRLRIASLDHAMWFHRPVRMDEWVLYDAHSPSAQGGRGLGTGKIFQDGRLVASVAQEGMIRVKPAQP